MFREIHQVRVFISSPGDVTDERNLARQLLSEELPRVPAFRGRVYFDPISWDDPAAQVAMLAGTHPQDSVFRSLPRPADCDFVVVIFWARMGTPLPVTTVKSNNERYLSGTEWEYEDAINSPKNPPVLLYRRTEKLKVDLDDPDLNSKRQQLKLVDDFFSRFHNPDGSISGGVNTYEKPSEFKKLLHQHLEQLVWERIKNDGLHAKTMSPKPGWLGSPFPGLRAFTTADAPIFFGRGAETDALISKLSDHCCVAVVGASGSGKSSLVGAGLIPRLKGGAVPGGKAWNLPEYDTTTRQWVGLRFTPGEIDENPFRALAAKLAPLVQRRVPDIVKQLESDSEILGHYLGEAVDRGTIPRISLLFIDQFEELFTLCDDSRREPFSRFLERCCLRDDLRIVLTMRSDFYQNCVEIPSLAKLLEIGTFPLPPPRDTLLEMIVRPAQQVALDFEEGVAGQILQDTGSEPGALALLAYTLDELYRSCQDKRKITRSAYYSLGGVHGAIGKRAEHAFSGLGPSEKESFGRVFGELISVDESGKATRRRAKLRSLSDQDQAEKLIEVFTNERLLTISDEQEPIVEVAHEAIFRNWARLEQWIRKEQEDLILLRQVRQEAAFWEIKGCKDAYLWSGDRLKDARAMIGRKNPILSDIEREFVRSEVDRLMEVISNSTTDHFQRAEIGDRLALIGDTRRGVSLTQKNIPDIEWCAVNHSGAHFSIAKYPITYSQYRCFIEANSMEDQVSRVSADSQFRKIGNCPAENVSFGDANRFCNWLSNLLGYKVRLPTEEEWECAARPPSTHFDYPWGRHWNPNYANTSESRLSRTTAVGMYPLGVAACGAFDMIGNVWEWTTTDGAQGDDHILHGGSWLTGAELAGISSRRPHRDTRRSNNVGFRPIAFVS